MEQPRTNILLAGGLIALLALMGMWTATAATVLSALYGDIEAEARSAKKIRMVYAMRKTIWQRHFSTLRVQALDDFFDRDEERQRFNSYAGGFVMAREQYIGLGMAPEEKVIMDFLLTRVREARPFVEKSMEIAVEGENHEAIEAAFEKGVLAQTPLLKTLDRMVAFQENLEEQRSKEIKARQEKTTTILIVLAVIVFALSFIISIFVFRRETRQTNSLFREINEREQAETLARASKEEAEIANRAKSEFLANMSHELRTPLNSILGFSEVLAKEIFGPHQNPKYKDYAASIHQAGSHLLKILGEILDISKIEAGEATVEDTDIDIAKALDDCVTMVKPRAAAGGIEIRVDCSDESPFLRADERHFKQIMLNLLSNAVKFTEKGGLITVAIRQCGCGGKEIAIADTGIGISPKDIPKVMDPFGQVADSHARNHDGVGLGLPICKSLLELHDGSLNIESEVGKGSVVTVRFPPERTVHKA